MSWKDEYETAVKKYFDIPLDATISIDDDCSYYEGCPTCGGDYEFVVYVYTNLNNFSHKSYTYNGKMTEFLASLPD